MGGVGGFVKSAVYDVTSVPAAMVLLILRARDRGHYRNRDGLALPVCSTKPEQSHGLSMLADNGFLFPGDKLYWEKFGPNIGITIHK